MIGMAHKGQGEGYFELHRLSAAWNSPGLLAAPEGS